MEQGVKRKKRTISKETMIDNIVDNYVHVEKAILEQLYMKHDLHGGTIGNEREDIWKQLFKMIIPRKFAIEQSVFIIDSSFDPEHPESGISREVDLVIFDEMYTPYIFRYGRFKFIPIEAVAVVVECKSRGVKAATVLDWCNRMDTLLTSNRAVARMATLMVIGETKAIEEKEEKQKQSGNATQTSTRPIKIFCSIDDNKTKISKIKERFDFVLTAVDKADKNSNNRAGNGEKQLRIEVTNKIDITKEDDTLKDWHIELNHHNEEKQGYENQPGYKSLDDYSLENYKVKREGKEISLLSFNFMLNQLLMLINNPILFPHRAYVDMFNRKGSIRTNPANK